MGRRGGLGGGLGRTPPPCLRLLEPVALAVQLQNMDMMREAIEKRASETLAAEDGGPFLKGKIRRDDGRAAFVTLAEYFEEKLRAGLRERHIAESAVVKKETGKPRWQAARPSARQTCVFPVPELPRAITLSRATTYSQRASSRTSGLLSDGMAVKSNVSKLFTAGKRAARMRRSTRLSRTRPPPKI
jgi:hypothetical protein